MKVTDGADATTTTTTTTTTIAEKKDVASQKSTTTTTTSANNNSIHSNNNNGDSVSSCSPTSSSSSASSSSGEDHETESTNLKNGVIMNGAGSKSKSPAPANQDGGGGGGGGHETGFENGSSSDRDSRSPTDNFSNNSSNKSMSKKGKGSSETSSSTITDTASSSTPDCDDTTSANNESSDTTATTAQQDLQDEKEGGSGDASKAEGPTVVAEDVYYVHDSGLTIKIIAPAAEPFEIQVSSTEIVQELHQLLMEREDTCHRTCFSLQLDGNTLDNFAELKSIPGLKDGSVIKVVEEPYTCREARIHVKHVRDLLKPSDWADAYAGTDCASLSFLNAVSGGELSGKKRVVDCTPPDYIMPGGGSTTGGVTTINPLLLTPLHPLNKDQKPISCLKVS